MNQCFENSSSYDLPLLTAEQREGGSGSVPEAAGRSFGAATAAASQVPSKPSILQLSSEKAEVDLYLQLLAGHSALLQLPQAQFLKGIPSFLLTAEQREGGSGFVPAAAGRSFDAGTAAAGPVPKRHSIFSVDS